MRPKVERTRAAYTSSSPPRDPPIPSSGAFESRPSPLRSRSFGHFPSAPALDDTTFVTDELESLQLSPRNTRSPDSNNPRSFPYSMKQQCWEKAEKVKGRDPDRWRKDTLGNIVFRKFVGCPGCFCHDYDHIIPYSKGGKSTLENCQVLQATVNRSKGNKTDLSRADLIRKSSYCRVAGRDMDVIELTTYGNVRHVKDSGGCSIQ